MPFRVRTVLAAAPLAVALVACDPGGGYGSYPSYPSYSSSGDTHYHDHYYDAPAPQRVVPAPQRAVSPPRVSVSKPSTTRTRR